MTIERRLRVLEQAAGAEDTWGDIRREVTQFGRECDVIRSWHAADNQGCPPGVPMGSYVAWQELERESAERDRLRRSKDPKDKRRLLEMDLQRHVELMQHFEDVG